MEVVVVVVGEGWGGKAKERNVLVSLLQLPLIMTPLAIVGPVSCVKCKLPSYPSPHVSHVLTNNFGQLWHGFNHSHFPSHSSSLLLGVATSTGYSISSGQGCCFHENYSTYLPLWLFHWMLPLSSWRLGDYTVIICKNRQEYLYSVVLCWKGTPKYSLCQALYPIEKNHTILLIIPSF